MRCLLDTNILVYLVNDIDRLSKDVFAITSNPENQLYASTESARELVVAFRNKRLLTNRWKTPEEMLRFIETETGVKFLPVRLEHVFTYTKMTINERQDHKDPSDHIIIAHAITEKLTLISSDARFEFYRDQGLDFIYNKP